MSSGQSNPELAGLENIIRRSPHGIGVSALVEEYFALSGRKLSSRTALRRLTELIESGKIRPIGKGRARRYYPVDYCHVESQGGVYNVSAGVLKEEPVSQYSAHSDTDDLKSFESYRNFTHEAHEVVRLVRRPVIQRPAVGYNPDFLERYKPGDTWYLPEAARMHLAELGRIPNQDSRAHLPAGTYARNLLEW